MCRSEKATAPQFLKEIFHGKDPDPVPGFPADGLAGDAQFPGAQSIQLVADGTSSEEVPVPSLQLPGTGTAKGKLDPPVLMQPMDFIKEGRDLLHFVHYNEWRF